MVSAWLCARAFLGAQDQAHRRVLTRFHSVLAGVAELSDLEVDNNQALEAVVKEQRIDADPAVIDAPTPWSADDSEVVAHLQEEVGQMHNQRFFEV